MDNPEEVYYQALEEQYLKDNAKFKKGDAVYYEYAYNKNNQQKLGMTIGIVNEVLLLKTPVARSGKQEVINVIGYKIINPRELVTITECKCTSVSEYIFREYLKHSKKQAKQAD